VADVLIKQSSEPGELVADPFMGSGSVGVAALKLGRRFAGNDLNPEAVQIAGRRLAALGSDESGPGDTRAPHHGGGPAFRRTDDTPTGVSGSSADQLSLLPERR
jgi:hypothetical protein